MHKKIVSLASFDINLTTWPGYSLREPFGRQAGGKGGQEEAAREGEEGSASREGTLRGDERRDRRPGRQIVDHVPRPLSKQSK